MEKTAAEMTIRAAAFHEAFGAEFAPRAEAAGFRRQGRQASKWRCAAAGHPLLVNFRVNPKAAGLPGVPGEFWPVIDWQGPRYGVRDDGSISYYQYASEADLAEIQALRHTVIDKAGPETPYLAILRQGLELPLRIQGPDVALFYLDEADAGAWGSWFGARIAAWLGRFNAAPETLESWCWRVLWAK
jgi:hypothetical protein